MHIVNVSIDKRLKRGWDLCPSSANYYTIKHDENNNYFISVNASNCKLQ